MQTDRVDINRVLMQMRAMKTQAQGPQVNVADGIHQQGGVSPVGKSGLEALKALESTSSVNQVNKAQAPGFGQMFAQAVNSVNNTQKQSGQLQEAYQMGDPNVSISQVMVASQKSTVAFQAMTQVRNKLIGAYEDIKNMPI
jgi:flagellar hook-basal body complex protein FliE